MIVAPPRETTTESPTSRSTPGQTPGNLSREEVAILTEVAMELHPSDTEILIRLIARVAELERTHGEEVALAMLESATEYFSHGRSPN